MKISRRDFIKTGFTSVVGGLVVYNNLPSLLKGLGLPEANRRATSNPSNLNGSHLRFLVDIRKCIGCGSCVRACKQENGVPMEPEYNRTWVERYVIDDKEEIFVDSPNAGIDGFKESYMNEKYKNLNIRKSFFVPKLCNQCQHPACVQVCPVKATYISKEGVVLVDRKACIGCRYCVQACPYGARFLDPRLKVVDKCTWCYHRITKGLIPACQEVCPVGARIFGDISDPNSQVSKLLENEAVGILKPDLGTEPTVYYIGLEKGVR